MAMRNIVKIDQEKCNGCGRCANACAEKAIEIVDGKARLVSEIYCDGLGACIGHCPQGAITIEQSDAKQFDEQATSAHIAKKEKSPLKLDFVCPGMMAKKFSNDPQPVEAGSLSAVSQLSHWPVQLKLVSPQAAYFAGADLLLVADCVPFAMANFHEKFLKNRSIVIGCPKLDDTKFYIEKLSELLKINKLKSFTVVHMEVPCCSGLTYLAKEAIIRSGVKLSFEDVTISLRGNVLKKETID